MKILQKRRKQYLPTDSLVFAYHGEHGSIFDDFGREFEVGVALTIAGATVVAGMASPAAGRVVGTALSVTYAAFSPEVKHSLQHYDPLMSEFGAGAGFDEFTSAVASGAARVARGLESSGGSTPASGGSHSPHLRFCI